MRSQSSSLENMRKVSNTAPVRCNVARNLDVRVDFKGERVPKQRNTAYLGSVLATVSVKDFFVVPFFPWGSIVLSLRCKMPKPASCRSS